MAKFKTIELSANRGETKIKVQVNIDSQGDFYCKVPDELKIMFETWKDMPKGVIMGREDKIFAKVFVDLENALKSAIYHRYAPIVVQEKVIRYSIKNAFQYCLVDGDTVAPNGNWAKTEAYKFMGDSAKEGAQGISIVAKAQIKTTTTMGSKVTVKYDDYYGPNGSHHGISTPAEKLNSWGGHRISEHFVEIPYSDESALFFFDVMMGMARLAHLIRTNTDSVEKIMGLIESKQGLLGGPTS